MSFFKKDPLTDDIRGRLKAFIEEKKCDGNKKNKDAVVAAASEIPYIKKPIDKKFTREALCAEIKEAIKPFDTIVPPSKTKSLYDQEQLAYFKTELYEGKAELELEEKTADMDMSDSRRALYHTIQLINTVDGFSHIIQYSNQADGLIKASNAIRLGIYNDFRTDDPCMDALVKVLLSREGGPEDENLKLIKKYVEEKSCNPELKSFLLRKKYPNKDSISRLSPRDKQTLADILGIADTSNDALFDAVQSKKGYPTRELIRGPLFQTHPEFFELKAELAESKYGELYQHQLEAGNGDLIPKADTVDPYNETFDVYNIEKDGNCLFTAMAGHLNAIHFLELTDWNQSHIRQNLVKFYKKSPLFRDDHFFTNLAPTRSSYLKALESGCDSSYCGEDRYGTTMDVMAFAVMCKINVKIYYIGGEETCYYDTTEQELIGRYDSIEQYAPGRKIPANLHKPMYLKLEVRRPQHFDLLILKKGARDPIQSTYDYPGSYIPFPDITVEKMRSKVRQMREHFYAVLRIQESEEIRPRAAGAAGGAADDGFGQEGGFPSVERMVRLKEQKTEPHAVTGLGVFQDFQEQDPDIMARMINCLQ
jgi:hypothetical protein